MEFGESIAISNQHSCLLIDCGTECKKTSFCIQPIVNDLKKYTEKTLMISHFHDDHINCILPLHQSSNVIFERVYLPDIFSNFGILNLTLLKYYLQKRFSSGFTIWDIIRQILKNKSAIFLLKKCSIFYEIGYDWEVYWPDNRCLANISVSYEKIVREINNDELVNLLDRISKDICELVISYAENRQNRQRAYSANRQRNCGFDELSCC